MNNQENDIRLIRVYRASGEMSYLGRLYEPYIPLVFGVCMKYLKNRERSEDAVMEIFEGLVDKVKKHEIRNFKSWLHVLTRNHCLMILRSAEWKKQQDIENISEISVEFPSLPHHDNGTTVLEANMIELKRCIDHLQEEQKRCISMFYLEERSYREIASETEFDLNKVKSYIQNGKRNLKICLEKKRGKL